MVPNKDNTITLVPLSRSPIGTKPEYEPNQSTDFVKPKPEEAHTDPRYPPNFRPVGGQTFESVLHPIGGVIYDPVNNSQTAVFDNNSHRNIG